jgi:hypothetical protein
MSLWVVFEMIDTEEPDEGDDLFKLYGPFGSEEDAEHYCQLRGFDGVIEVEPSEG